MSQFHTFLFEGLPVRGAIVRLDEAWQQVQSRRASNSETGAYPPPVRALLGQMLAAGVLMQSGLKFNGALILQVQGDGPVKLAVAEVRSDLGLRATATLQGDAASLGTDPAANLGALVNVGGAGRCAITLDPHNRQPGQQPYQGIVPLSDAQGQALTSLSAALEHYMRQSEQLDTTVVLAANDHTAAGLLVQRMPLKGEGNLAANLGEAEEADRLGHNEDYNRIAHLAASLTEQELLTLDVETILHRLFWEEKLLRFVPEPQHALVPHFACACSRERVAAMLRNLGEQELESILSERPQIEVGCEFCGQQYQFDPVDAAQLFTAPLQQPPASQAIQ